MINPQKYNPFDSFRDGQREAILELIESYDEGVAELSAPTGAGKCLGKDTSVIMYDGSIKMSQDIVTGDVLMGPDSQPRNVLATSRGNGKLYRVTPIRGGNSFVCNGNHVLSLKRTNDGKKVGSVCNVSVDDYFGKVSHFKHVHKLWHTGVIEFENCVTDFEIPPYLLGLWLGDGDLLHFKICNPEPEIGEYIFKYAKSVGLQVSTYDDKHCMTYNIQNQWLGNPYRDYLKKVRAIHGEKCIPKEYLTSDVNSRLELLAGLLDTDGFYKKAGYEIIVKNNILADGVEFLARSLGISVNRVKKIGTIKEIGFSGIYNRLYLSGSALENVPCKVPRKMPTKRLQKKDALVSGFKIEPIGEGDYYGFEIDGDNLFLLGDFTVTHNSVLLYAGGMGLMEQYGLSRVIYTTPQTSLVDQLEKDHFKGTAVLKGQQNYRCDLYPEELDVSSCPKRAAEGRNFQPCPECTYWQLRREFVRSRFGIATLDLVLSTKKLSDADVLIVDESSDLEMALLRHYEVSLPAYVTEKNMIEGLEQWHEEMEKKYKEIQIEVNELYSSISKNKKSMERFTKVSRQLLRTESHLQKVDEIIGMVNAGWPYLINEVKEGNDVRRKFKLVMGARLFNQLRDRYGYIILASGTPTTESLTKEYTKVVMPSPIPAKQRMVYYYTKIGKMNRDSKAATIPRMAKKILEIYEADGSKNTLVHCHSYDVASQLYARTHRYAPVILQSRETRESALEDFKAGENNIYLSVNYAQGIDLKGEKFQTNIIAKVPYPNLGDAWVLKRKEADAGAWYNMTTAVAVQQACGRCTRGPTDYSKSYILDASFVGFLRRCKSLLQPWFVEALVKVDK